MTEQEKREKIFKIISKGILHGEDNYGMPTDKTIENIADALIEAGCGDVKEAEHRAEVAERAGRIIQRDMARVFDISKPRVCELIANIWDLAKKQAEKELAEERKDEGEN